MCGICGIAFADRRRVVQRARLETMCATIAHRGPDDSGLFLAGPVGLGHRRLSIVDVAHGQQPMTNEDESVWIAFNGEIYNHADFHDRLVARGHRYRTRCDTEAIVHLFEEVGNDAFAHLNGMFGIALWNSRTNTLTLARDRMGVKPIYYALTPEGDLVFGSEIKAIFASGLVEAELDVEAVPEYFATGHVAGERTLYRGVRRLLGGTCLTWRAGVARVQSYWRLLDLPYAADTAADEVAQPADEFWSIFTASVRKMLMADVPLGVFLSGGLDSSLIVAAMREAGVTEPRSFSVGFTDREANELPFARVVAKAFGTRHHEVVVTPQEFFNALPELTWHRDLPLTFSASLPLYFVSRLAQEHVKVVLTGEGADELFAGYGRYARGLTNLRLAQTLDERLPRSARRAVAFVASRLGNGYLGSRLRRSFLANRGTFEEAYLEAFTDVDRHARRGLLKRSGRAPYESALRFLDRDLLALQPVEAMLRFDQLTYLDELLMKQDTMSMASSIESRVPFLDETLVDWASTLPGAYKLRGGLGKAVVRAAAARHLPDEIVRAKKRGFLVPMRRWLAGPGRSLIIDHLPASDDDLLQRAPLEAMLRRHEGGTDHSPLLWRVLAFQVWRQQTLPRMRALASTATDEAPSAAAVT